MDEAKVVAQARRCSELARREVAAMDARMLAHKQLGMAEDALALAREESGAAYNELRRMIEDGVRALTIHEGQ